jgi:cytochrome P450
MHALHDAFRKMRSFVFIERVSEVTDVFTRERDFAAVSDAIARDAGVADISGYTDYGRVWAEFRDLVEDDLHPRRPSSCSATRARTAATRAPTRSRRSPRAPAGRSG